MKIIKNLTILISILMSVVGDLSFAQTQGVPQPISWKFKTGGIIQATPLISNNILYIGSFDSCFYAIDSKTGVEKWRYKTQNQIYSTPVKYNNILCFESGNVLYGLNLQGELVWKFTMYDGPFMNQHDEWDYYHSSPLLVDSTVYIGSEKGLVFGVNVLTGEKVFQCQTPSADFTIETTPAVYDNKIYFGDWDGVFFAYDLSTAAIVWSYDTKKDNTYNSWVNAIVTDPVIINGEVFFGGRSCNLYCIDAKTGEKKWHVHDPAGDMWTLGGPTYADGVLYMGSSYQHTARAFSTVNGRLLWQSNLEYRTNGKPLVDGKYVIVGTEHDTDLKLGGLVVLDRSNGKIISKLNLPGQVYSSPILNDSLIYFGATDKNIYAVSYHEMKHVAILTLKGSMFINCGKRNNNASFDTTLYVYNTGIKSDSINITTTMNEVTFSPSNFILAPNDSQKVTIRINPTGLEAKNYSSVISILSNMSIPQTTLTRTLKFTVQNVTDVSKDEKKIETYSLKQNYPNPFNPETVIEYQLPEFGHVQLKVFNIIGREVATLVDEEQNAGEYRVKFTTSNFNGFSSGIYFYQIKAGSFIKISKMILMK